VHFSLFGVLRVREGWSRRVRPRGRPASTAFLGNGGTAGGGPGARRPLCCSRSPYAASSALLNTLFADVSYTSVRYRHAPVAVASRHRHGMSGSRDHGQGLASKRALTVIV